MYGTSWTGALVRERLIELFRVLPDTPIYSTAPNRFEVWGECPVDGLDLVAATAACLGRESSGRLALLTYARLRAGEESIRAFCLQPDTPFPRPTLYRKAREASEEVAACLNLLRRSEDMLQERACA